MKTDREKLIDFVKWLCEGSPIEVLDAHLTHVDEYIKSINKALDETKTVNNNEQTKEVFYCRKGDGSHGVVSCDTECFQCKFEREN